MDVKIGPHWYRNSNGTIEIHGLPQIEIALTKRPCPLSLNFAIFDDVGILHAKVEGSSMAINESQAYELIKTDHSLLLRRKESDTTILDMKLTEGERVEILRGQFYTLKGHLLKITPTEWSVEKTKVREGEQDMGGKSVSLG